MLISFIKLHETSQEYSPQCVEAFGVFIKFKMADVAMVTKVQKLLNLFQISRNFTVMFLVTCRFANRDIKFQNGCSQFVEAFDGLRNFKMAVITMETKVPKQWDGVTSAIALQWQFQLRHPDCSRVTYCYSTFLFHYYYSSTHFCPLDFSEMP